MSAEERGERLRNAEVAAEHARSWNHEMERRAEKAEAELQRVLGACDRAWAMVADHELALRVVYELLEDGPGNAAQLAERLNDKDEDGITHGEAAVDDALALLDRAALLDYPSLEEGSPIHLQFGRAS